MKFKNYKDAKPDKLAKNEVRKTQVILKWPFIGISSLSRIKPEEAKNNYGDMII